jgi:uncharacterized protein (DUF433 family)
MFEVIQVNESELEIKLRKEVNGIGFYSSCLVDKHHWEDSETKKMLKKELQKQLDRKIKSAEVFNFAGRPIVRGTRNFHRMIGELKDIVCGIEKEPFLDYIERRKKAGKTSEKEGDEIVNKFLYLVETELDSREDIEQAIQYYEDLIAWSDRTHLLFGPFPSTRQLRFL